MFKPRILIVEDNQQVLNVLISTCTKLGYDTLSADSVESSTAILRKEHETLHAAIVDIYLEDGNGLDIIREIHKISEDLSIIVATGDPDFNIMQKAIMLGIDGFLLKPIKFDVLSISLKNAVKHTRDSRYSKHMVAGLQRLLNEKMIEASENFTGVIESFIQAVEEKDTYTRDHSRNVSRYAYQIGEILNLNKHELSVVQSAAALHDIGKIWIPDEILNKPFSLDQDEWKVIKEHPGRGAKIIEKIPFLELSLPGIQSHHEHYNGNGYPNKLKGKDIPYVASIISVADAYDAMASNRAYRNAMDKDRILSIFFEEREKQFHPDCTDAMIHLIQMNEI